MTARPMTIAQPPANPCTNRAIIITTMFGATAHSDRRGRHHQHGDDERDPAATLIRHGPAHQLADRHPHEERRQGQLHLRRRRGQVVRHRREGRHIHVGRQRRDRREEHDRRHQCDGDPRLHGRGPGRQVTEILGIRENALQACLALGRLTDCIHPQLLSLVIPATVWSAMAIQPVLQGARECLPVPPSGANPFPASSASGAR